MQLSRRVIQDMDIFAPRLGAGDGRISHAICPAASRVATSLPLAQRLEMIDRFEIVFQRPAANWTPRRTRSLGGFEAPR
jgi:hypothetical protein